MELSKKRSPHWNVNTSIASPMLPHHRALPQSLLAKLPLKVHKGLQYIQKREHSGKKNGGHKREIRFVGNTLHTNNGRDCCQNKDNSWS